MTNISSRKYLVLISIGLLSLEIHAQNLGVKPFLGYQQTQIHTEKSDDRISSGICNSWNPTWGIMVDYRLKPKLRVELGWRKNPLTLNFDWKDPNTGKLEGFFHYSCATNNFTALANYTICNSPEWLKLNIIGGVELMRPQTGSVKSEKYFDTSTTDVPDFRFTVNTKKMLLLNLGMETEFLINNKPYGALRVMSGIGFSEYTSMSLTKDAGNTSYNCKYTINGTYLSMTLLLNLSTIFFDRFE